MILANKRTQEKFEVSYSKFRKKFVNELQATFASYRQTHLNKYSWLRCGWVIIVHKSSIRTCQQISCIHSPQVYF